MVRIGTVWDRTVEVISGRTAILASIAALTLFLPTVVRDAITLAVAGGPAATLLGAVVGVIMAVVTIWGMLALIAVASDPAVDRAGGFRIGAAALPGTILVVIVLGLAFGLLFLPAIILLSRAGFDFTAAAAGATQPGISPGALGAVSLYSIALLAVAIWAGARLAVLYPVLVNERRGLGSIARSFDLTRGLTWKIIGVLILYGVVFLVVLLAATSVAGLIFRLVLGGENATLVQFLAAVVGAAVTAVFGVLQAVFTAQLYLAARHARESAPPPV